MASKPVHLQRRSNQVRRNTGSMYSARLVGTW
jgi:hypothetical protein